MSKKARVKRVKRASVPEETELTVESEEPVEEKPVEETLADKILAIYNEGLLGNVLLENWKRFLAKKTGASQRKVAKAWESLWPLVPRRELPK